MKNYFLTLNILFIGLVMGPAMLALVAFALIQTGSFVPDTDGTLSVIFGSLIPAIGIGAFFASKITFERRMPAVIAMPNLEEKLAAYRTELILKYALLESPSILAFLAYLLTGAMLFFFIGSAMLAFMIMVRPTREGAVMHLALSAGDAAAVRGEVGR